MYSLGFLKPVCIFTKSPKVGRHVGVFSPSLVYTSADAVNPLSDTRAGRRRAFDRPLACNETRLRIHAAAGRRRPDVHADNLSRSIDRQGAGNPAKHRQDDPPGT